MLHIQPRYVGPITAYGGQTYVTSQTGTGSTFVMQASPALTTPNIGTPSAGTLTNCTGLPISTGVSGLGTGIATFLGTPSSANLRAALTDETGTGAAVFAGSPTLTGRVVVEAASEVFAINLKYNSATNGIWLGNTSTASTLSIADAGGTTLAQLAGTGFTMRSSGQASGDWHLFARSDLIPLFKFSNVDNGDAVGDFALLGDSGGGMTEVVHVKRSSLNVGVGMVPTRKLDVTGTFGATGAATLGSTLDVTGAITGSSSITDSKADVRTIPQNSKSAAYTTVLSDAGKHILHPSADTTARTFTIDSNANVAYPIGTAITFVNQNSAGTLTISITSDTMRLAGPGTTGSRTLTANGVATALKITSTEWIIWGVNLS